MASLSLRHIYKVYAGGVRAVSDFNLEIDDKEFIVFVGPSGCGKSTTLRMIAGLEDISKGELYIDDVLVNDMEPKDRDIAMVFQNYALYPHMTVYDNMAFGLRLRKMPTQEINDRVQEAAQILGIEHLLARRPKALSGGQRQRVALGRAIVREPKVFLLDEPLSNLDAKLRVQMRTEITKIHHRLATTFIYVTHDQTEAMTMGTRIVVMKDGIVQQVDTPAALYDTPANLFVACFLGSPQMNLFNCVLQEENGVVYAVFGKNKIIIPKAKIERILDKSIIGKKVIMGIRPEDVHYEQSMVERFSKENNFAVIDAEVDVIENLGNEAILYLKVDSKDDYTIARINTRSIPQEQEVIRVALDTNKLHFFDPETELTLMGVPRYNKIPAKLRAEEDVLTVRFGNTRIVLPQNVAERLKRFDAINSDVILGISPSSLKSGQGEAMPDTAFEIKGEIKFSDKYPRFKAVYAEVEGKDNGYVIMERPLDEEVSGGQQITALVDPNDIQIFSLDGEPLLCALKAEPNDIYANVKVNGNLATLSFGSSKLVMTTNDQIRSDGVHQIHIDPFSISVNKEKVPNKPHINGVITKLDEHEKGVTVYAAVLGMNAPLMAHLESLTGYNEGDRIRFTIEPAGIKEKSAPTVQSAIENAAHSTPPYVYIAPKKVKQPEPVPEPAAVKSEAEETVAVKKVPAAAAPKAPVRRTPGKSASSSTTSGRTTKK